MVTMWPTPHETAEGCNVTAEPRAEHGVTPRKSRWSRPVRAPNLGSPRGASRQRPQERRSPKSPRPVRSDGRPCLRLDAGIHLPRRNRAELAQGIIRAGAPPLSTLPTTVGSTVQAHCNRLVAELERGVTETGTQGTDAPPVETLHDVRQSIPRGVPHSRPHLRNYGVRCRSSEGCHQPFPPCSGAFSGFPRGLGKECAHERLQRLAPTARALVAAAFALGDGRRQGDFLLALLAIELAVRHG